MTIRLSDSKSTRATSPNSKPSKTMLIGLSVQPYIPSSTIGARAAFHKRFPKDRGRSRYASAWQHQSDHARFDRYGESFSLRSLRPLRSEEHTSELQSLMRISYAVFCLKKKKKIKISSIQIHRSTNKYT